MARPAQHIHSATASTAIVEERLAGARVLIVDDSPDVRKILRRILERAGVEVQEANDGSMAVNSAVRLQPDTILLDLEMPGTDGLTATAQLRAAPETRDIPICILTGHDADESHAAALERGADDFVSKPVHRRILLARVANLVGRYRAERENLRLLADLKRYVSQAAKNQAMQHREVERLHATILFSDLRGFTATSFEKDLEPVFQVMNEVLAHQTGVVRHWGGYVDKFSGDGMLAVFCDEKSAWQACRAAQEIVRWARKWHDGIWDPLPVALGIHWGEVLRGDLGSEERREFTVLGSTVNTAARLCGVANALEVVVSDEVETRISHLFAFGETRTVSLKGLPISAVLHPLLVPDSSSDSD